MPVTIVAGGQYGSEGKGKTALEIAKRSGADIVAVRVGGANSGHTAYDRSGHKRVFRQLPVAAVDGCSLIALPPGNYIDLPVLQAEIAEFGLQPGKLLIDPAARIITQNHKEWEAKGGLTVGIGSTGSGTGAAVLAAAARNAANLGLSSPRAAEIDMLRPFLGETTSALRSALAAGRRVIVEGTQGFGLSVLHGEWPHATSRDTTAAGFLSETGLSPFDVDDITLVIRCHPIRVAGASGSLPEETNWMDVASTAGADCDLTEMTTVTGRVRRVGLFQSDLVRAAIAANRPSRIVLNHLDYVDWQVRSGEISERALAFIRSTEQQIGARVDWVGVNEREFVEVPSGHSSNVVPLRSGSGF